MKIFYWEDKHFLEVQGVEHGRIRPIIVFATTVKSRYSVIHHSSMPVSVVDCINIII